MNEWSPGGNHIRPETPKQTGRSLRSQWDESENGTKIGSVSLRAVSDNRSKARQHYKDNISKTSLSTCNKTRSKLAEPFLVSDPRFKRIIPPGNQNDVCIGTETKKSKSTLELQDVLKAKPANFTSPEFKSNQPIGDSNENAESREKTESNLPLTQEPKNANATEALKSEQSQDNLKLVEKLGFNHSLVESFSKESLSDSCASTKNASLASEESGPDFSRTLDPFPSATRVKKVQNWILDQQSKPEKKQSVVTVIGQTQGSDTLSSALQEIDKRRKLVKQLDKYAVCKKILDSEKDNEISEIFTKVGCLTQSGKLWAYGDTNEDPKINVNVLKTTDESPYKFPNVSKNEKTDTNKKVIESVKQESKTTDAISECSIKGRVRLLLSRIPYQWIFCVLISLSVVLCGIMYLTIQKNNYVSFDLFTPKPKPLTWYEKIGLWIWELFRPSDNYRRTAPWEQYLN